MNDRGGGHVQDEQTKVIEENPHIVKNRGVRNAVAWAQEVSA